MADLIRTGILSYGMSGKVFHAPLLDAHPSFRLKKVLERNSARAMERYSYVEISKSMEEFLSDPELDLVIVNTPNSTHYEFAKKALQAGKHVVLEKPFTNTVEEGQELIGLAEKQGLLLTAFQNRRWDSDFLTVQQVLKSGMLGEIVEFEAHYDRFRNYVEENTWKEERAPGSGILYNLGSHMLDQALVLFGLPKSITADIRIQRPGGTVDDNYEVVMDYGKVKVTVKSSYMVREQGPRYMIYGVEGSFIKYGLDVQEQALKEGFLPGGPEWGVEPEFDWGIINTQIGGLHVKGNIESLPGNYMAFYENLAAAISEGAELAVKPEQALDVIKVIEVARQSSDEGKKILL